MAMKVKGKAIPKVATQIDENRLKKHEWAVHTDDSITQNAISDYLSKRGEGELSTKEIFHDGIKVCFSVSFDIVLFLLKNKHRVPYKFTPYHKESRSAPWRMWKEGMKSPGEYLSKMFERPK